MSEPSIEKEVRGFDGSTVQFAVYAEPDEAILTTTSDRRSETLERPLDPTQLLVATFAIEHTGTPFYAQQLTQPDGTRLNSNAFTTAVSRQGAGVGEGLRTYLDRVYGKGSLWRKEGRDHTLGIGPDTEVSHIEGQREDPLASIQFSDLQQTILDAVRRVDFNGTDLPLFTLLGSVLQDLRAQDIQLHISRITDTIRGCAHKINNLSGPGLLGVYTHEKEDFVHMDPALYVAPAEKTDTPEIERGKERVRLLRSLFPDVNYLAAHRALHIAGLSEVRPAIQWEFNGESLFIDDEEYPIKPNFARVLSVIKDFEIPITTEQLSSKFSTADDPEGWVGRFRVWAELCMHLVNLYAPVVCLERIKQPDKPTSVYTYNATGSWEALDTPNPQKARIPPEYQEVGIFQAPTQKDFFDGIPIQKPKGRDNAY